MRRRELEEIKALLKEFKEEMRNVSKEGIIGAIRELRKEG